MGSAGETVRTIPEFVTFYIWTIPFCSGYSQRKVQENNEAEIMDVVIEEARSSYPQEIVVELTSEGTEDLESNVSRLVQWIRAWRKDRDLPNLDS